MLTPRCKRYTGYRPCSPFRVCRGRMDDCLPFDSQWLLADLSHPGALLQDAAILALLEQRHPHTQVVAVTRSQALAAYQAHPLVDLVLPFDFESISILNILRFERTLAPKDDAEAGKLLRLLEAVPSKRLVLRGDAPEGLETRLTPGEGEGQRLLIINLDSLGDVLMTTALLPALERHWPGAALEWVTVPYAAEVLRHNPRLQRVIPYTEETAAALPDQVYDVLISVDKGRRSCALAELIPCPDKRGYGLNDVGHITYFNPEAKYAYFLGLDDHEKFRVNRKTGQQLLAESLGLEYERRPYILVLTEEEKQFVARYRANHGITPANAAIGFNTGCSEVYANKKMTIDQHVRLIQRIGEEIKGAVVLLLGGKQETGRNAEIAAHCRDAGVGGAVIETPTTEGLRRGILYIDACDAMVTGDTSALHMGIALGKFTVSWYGLSCWTEIDVYDRGVKFFQPDLECSPCWKKTCSNINPVSNLPECINRIDLEGMLAALKEFRKQKP